MESYDQATDKLLDRILDDYGLIVCGWSGEWDSALRGAITRAPSRRFTTFWADRGTRGEKARQLVDHRQAQLIPIKDADQFFVGLGEGVKALAEANTPHPLSAKVLVATAKRYLADDAYRIRLFDLVSEEVERARAAIRSKDFPLIFSGKPEEELPRRVQRFDALTIPLAELFATGCFFGGDGHVELWSRFLERLGTYEMRDGSYDDTLLRLQRYPALIVFYAAGIACTAAGKYQTLKVLFERTHAVDEFTAKREAFATGLIACDLMDGVGRLLSGTHNGHTPESDYLCKILRKPLASFLPGDLEYQEAFDRFEYFASLAFATFSKSDWIPLGSFAWRYRRSSSSLIGSVKQEVERLGMSWPPLQSGLFGGCVASFSKAAACVDSRIASIPF